jgi:hypothetical protein
LTDSRGASQIKREFARLLRWARFEKRHRTGESVSNASTVPDPIFTIGDTRSLSDAYGEKKFWGHAVRIGQELGRKNVRTDEPT